MSLSSKNDSYPAKSAPLSDGINVMAAQELRPSPQRFVTLATLISEKKTSALVFGDGRKTVTLSGPQVEAFPRFCLHLKLGTEQESKA